MRRSAVLRGWLQFGRDREVWAKGSKHSPLFGCRLCPPLAGLVAWMITNPLPAVGPSAVPLG